jgi:hypothetical protein
MNEYHNRGIGAPMSDMKATPPTLETLRQVLGDSLSQVETLERVVVNIEGKLCGFKPVTELDKAATKMTERPIENMATEIRQRLALVNESLLNIESRL